MNQKVIVCVMLLVMTLLAQSALSEPVDSAEAQYTDAACFLTEELENGTLAIVGYEGDDTEAVIPPEIGGEEGHRNRRVCVCGLWNAYADHIAGLDHENRRVCV